MSGIAALIKLNDQMSSTLKRIDKNVDKVISRLTKLENTATKSINKANAAQQRFNNSMRQGVSIASKLGNAIKVGLGTYLGARSVGQLVNVADELTMTTARLNLMNDGMKTTAELTDQIYQSAMRSRSGYLQTADAVAKLRLRAGQIFKTNDEAVAFSETLNKMFVVAGTSSQEMYSATLQLIQALGSGVLRGEEFRAVFEAAPNVMQAIADYMNLPIGKLRELSNEGTITADIVKNAMFAAAKKVDEQFKTIPMTWQQVWTSVKNFTIKLLEPILIRIREITASERFKKFGNAVGNVMAIIVKVLTDVFDLIVDIGAYIYDNWKKIEPILQAIALTYLGIMISKMVIMTGQLITQAVMWAIMNWKILLVIGAIALVIKIAADMGYTFNEILGTICAALTAVGVTVYNVFAYMYNNAASFIEFFKNGFTDSTYAVKKLFVDLATNFLDLCISMTQGWDDFATSFVNAIITGINEVLKGWNWLVDKLGVVGEKLGIGKATLIEKSTSITSDLSNAKDKLQNWLGEKPEAYESIERMEYKNVGELTKKAYDWGDKLADKLSETATKIEDYVSKTMDLENDLGKSLTGGFGNDNPALDKIAANTDKLVDNTSVDTTDEDLSYMIDLAEREAINKYTMSDVKIEMTNNNNVSSKFDLDDMVEYLQKKMYEGMVSNASGVHF